MLFDAVSIINKFIYHHTIISVLLKIFRAQTMHWFALKELHFFRLILNFILLAFNRFVIFVSLS